MKKYQFSKTELACLEQLRVPLGVYQFLDKRVAILALSAGFCDLFGFASLEDAYAVMSRDVFSTAHPDDAARLANAAYRFSVEKLPKMEEVYRIRSHSGNNTRIVHLNAEHVTTETGAVISYVWFTDEGSYAAESKEARSGEKTDSLLENIYRSVLHDDIILKTNQYDNLTSLPNMSYFFELVEAGKPVLLQEGKTPVFLFIDVSGMKYYNRKFGYSGGDKLLRRIAAILVKHFKSANCSRIGQDHFGVLTEADGLDEKIDQIFEECTTAGEDHSVALRVGAYIDEKGRTDTGIACDRARQACVSIPGSPVSMLAYFDETMLEAAEKRQYIINNLDRAIREKWIQVYYQPIVRAANSRVSNEEALARWIDPEKGYLSPADFIPVLEDARLIYKLDLCVLDQMLEKLNMQRKAGLYMVPSSINLSRYDFETCDIVEEIRRRVDDAGISRDLIVIEITESVIGSDFEYMKAQIERFRSLGFQVWMDDFGSGYSSLDVLQSISFDLIKLDMRFMQQFDKTDSSKIILTELIRMTIGLGIETITEGVETGEQVDFLREIGCTKLQGFYFCKPISYEEILHRYRTGAQIGFENPAETEYYTAIGRINLYDMSVIATEDKDKLQNYFNTLPMSIVESDGERFRVVRCNHTYREFMERMFGVTIMNDWLPYKDAVGPNGLGFLSAMRQCGEDGNRAIIDEEMSDGATAHAFIKRIAVNPVTGTKALVTAALGVIDETNKPNGVTYANIARALSSDYEYLYYVDLKTDEFVEYSSGAAGEQLSLERHGYDFFEASRQDALSRLYPDDQKAFRDAFVKENILRSMDEYGTFTMSYRQIIDGQPAYMTMKAVRMADDGRHIIIGVSNVDAQVRQREALKKIRQEQLSFYRVMALSDNFICIYAVDPDTEDYTEYNPSSEYRGLGLAGQGTDFFAQARLESTRMLYEQDRDAFIRHFTRENILETIRKEGSFTIHYRLLLGGLPTYVKAKAVMVEEDGKNRLLIGISNIEAGVRQLHANSTPES